MSRDQRIPEIARAPLMLFHVVHPQCVWPTLYIRLYLDSSAAPVRPVHLPCLCVHGDVFPWVHHQLFGQSQAKRSRLVRGASSSAVAAVLWARLAPCRGCLCPWANPGQPRVRCPDPPGTCAAAMPPMAAFITGTRALHVMLHDGRGSSFCSESTPLPSRSEPPCGQAQRRVRSGRVTSRTAAHTEVAALSRHRRPSLACLSRGAPPSWGAEAPSQISRLSAAAGRSSHGGGAEL